MLTRAFLIFAILAGLGSAGVAYYQWSIQIPSLIQQRDAEKKAKDDATTAHNLSKADLKQTTAALNQTKQDLAAKKSEREKAFARFDTQEKRAASLTDQLAKTSAALEDYGSLAREYKDTGLSPDEVVKLKGNLAAAQKQLVAVTGERDTAYQKYVATYERLKKYVDPDPDPAVNLPSDLKGSIAAVDPKWDFVVINVGSDNGVRNNGELLVSRGGKLVAKVLVRDVAKDHCIADMIPHWKFGDMIEGDVVTPAHPAALSADAELGATGAPVSDPARLGP